MDYDMMTVAQVADYLQLSTKTVRRLITEKKLCAYKVGDRSWRIARVDIELYCKSKANISIDFIKEEGIVGNS